MSIRCSFVHMSDVSGKRVFLQGKENPPQLEKKSEVFSRMACSHGRGIFLI